MRGIAIICVFLFHAQEFLFPKFKLGDSTGKTGLLNLLPTAYGWTGVELFLLVSGFVIHLGFLSGNQQFNLSVFYSKRFWRIYPPYLLSLLIFCFTGAGINYYIYSHEGLKDLFAHLFLVHNLFDRFYFSINGVYWSLALEMQLYLLYPLLLWLRKKYGINKTTLIIWLIMPLSYGITYFILSGSKIAQANFVLNYWGVWALGALLAERYFYNQILFKKYRGVIAAAGFILIILAGFYISPALSALISVVAWLAFFEWVLHAQINTKTYTFKILIAIGLCSYSIYLLHEPPLFKMLSWFNILGPRSYLAFVKAIPAFALIFVVSYLYYRIIELPSIKLGQYFRRKINLKSAPQSQKSTKPDRFDA